LDKLKEMAHEMDTNMNEGFNNICTWFLPSKEQGLCRQWLSQQQDQFCCLHQLVCINSLGVMPFYTKLFLRLGITMTDNVEHYLNVKEVARMKQVESGKTQNAKKERNKNKYLKLQQATRVAKMEFLKRAGVYRKGMNLDDPFNELLNGREVDEQKPPANKNKRKEIGYCEYCGKSDHLTKRSKNCAVDPGSSKKFRREDGSSLSGPPTAPVDEGDCIGPVIRPSIQLTDAALHNGHLELLPFDHVLNDDDDDSLACFLDDAHDEDLENDDDSVAVVGGTL
jgi:hypothetical protein